ncbi:MAG: cytochrome C oxidase subunit IV family protein [Candidatus Acidiferrales bacterium]
MTETNHEPGMTGYITIWVGLLCIVGIETFLTTLHISTHRLLAALLLLAFLEAGIALLYFMHLRYEKPSLFWSLVPAVIFVLFMMNHIWPDAYRVASMRLPIQ